MTRKKKPDDGPNHDVLANGTAVAEPPPETTVEPSSAQAPQGSPPPKNRPAASFAANSDRTTRVEVAVWSKLIKVSEQEEYTQHSLTLSRSWRDKEGNWFGNAAFRIHDIPVLLYLVQQAYQWCIAQRTQVTVESAEPLPF
jgi:hypothetical protein